MSDTIKVLVPDIGDLAEVKVIEVLIKVGDVVEVEQTLITLESDKASMDVPAPQAGRIEAVLVAVGDSITEGTPIVELVSETTVAASQSNSDANGHANSQSDGDGDGDGDEDDGDFLDIGGGSSNDDSTPAVKEVAANDREVRCQVLVLGAGPGGYTAAFRAADLGQDTVLVE
ncbi:MAG: dihydrolipoamide dehydrogenase, partial [Gammaproteobacteria bacterium]